MEKEELLKLVADPGKLVEAIKATKDPNFKSNYELWVKQWNTPQHKILTDKISRPDKTDANGKPILVARIPFPFQKLIVRRAAQFLCGNPIEIEAKTEKDSLEDQFIQTIKKTWDDNKLDYDSKTLAKLMMSETEAAELWFFEEAAPNYWKGTPNEQGNIKLRMRMKILANKYKDTLYPVYNATGDMIAFARGYQTRLGDQLIEHLDVYSEDARYLLTQDNSKWNLVREDEPSGKIPAIYYAQEDVEWVDVQWMIERIETLLSKLADTNDYFAHPVLGLEADDVNQVEWPEKDASGKAVLLKNGAKAGYIVWDVTPDSIKLELLQLRSAIMDMTDTPDISFDQVKGLGTYSGIALTMIFSGAHMKASEKEEIFGKGIQRRLNFLKVAHAVINTKFEAAVPLSIKPRFTYYVPKDTVEETNTLIAANGGKPLISQKTSVELSSLVKDADGELERMQEEGDAATAQQAKINSSGGGLDNLLKAM
jgi:SPP1 family phage portal protein